MRFRIPAPARAVHQLARTTTALLLAAAASLPAQAELVTYAFSGTVLADSGDRGFSTFSGFFRFDSLAVDAIPDVSTASYPSPGAPYGVQVSFDAGAPVVLQSSFFILVTNNLGGRDTFGFLGLNASGSSSMSFTAFDLTQSLFSSDALPLPTNGLTLAPFTGNDFTWDSPAGVLEGRFTGMNCVAGCAPVPEVDTSAMTLAGLAALAGLMARRRRGQGAAHIAA